MIVVFLLLAVVLISLISWLILIQNCKKYNVPGPRPLPIVGNGHLFVTKASEFLPLLRNLMLQYGDAYLVHLLHTPHVVLSHPKYVESLVSHPELIAKGKTYSHLQPWLGNGLLTSTGNRWRNTRKFLTPAFHFNIRQNFLPVFLKNEKILIEKLHEYKDGRSFNALPVMALTALDNVTESIMGVSVDAQQNSESKYVKSIEILAHIVSLRMRNPFMGEDAIFNFSSQKKQQDEALECVHSHTKKVITMRREELKRANITKLSENGHFDIGIKNKHAFLDLLLLAEVDGEKIKDDQVREEVDTFMFESLVSHPELIAKGKTYSHLQPWLGNGLLTSTGNRWRNTRKFLTPAFHFNILQNFLPVFLKNVKILIEKLHEYEDGRSFNVLPVMALTALDNVTESIMGVSVDAQQNSESKYVKSIEILAHIVSLRMRNPFMGEDAIFNFSSQKKQQDEALECVHSHTKKVITMRREELKRANITKLSENGHFDIGIKNKHAFLDLLLLAEVDGEKIKDDQVREEVDTFMFEGHDTTASGLTFALYCISKRADVQQKIIEEQKDILGEDLNRDPTYSEIQQMKYLDLVVKESLRLYPSVPLIGRMVTEDAQLGDLKVPKNTSILINILELQRHPDLYDNPMEFDPERFNTASANSAKNAFSWLAFSAGPRNCIGQKFAMLELKVTLAGIVKHFHLLPDNFDEPVLCAELVLRSEPGVQIKLKPRKLT